MDNDVARELEIYLDIWTRILSAALGWSPEQVRAWAQPFLEGEAELTLHEPPSEWITPLLVPKPLQDVLNFEKLGRLHSDIRSALDQGNSFWRPNSGDDISDAMKRVHAVVKLYQEEAEHPVDLRSDAVARSLLRDLEAACAWIDSPIAAGEDGNVETTMDEGLSQARVFLSSAPPAALTTVAARDLYAAREWALRLFDEGRIEEARELMSSVYLQYSTPQADTESEWEGEPYIEECEQWQKAA